MEPSSLRVIVRYLEAKAGPPSDFGSFIRLFTKVIEAAANTLSRAWSVLKEPTVQDDLGDLLRYAGGRNVDLAAAVSRAEDLTRRLRVIGRGSLQHAREDLADLKMGYAISDVVNELSRQSIVEALRDWSDSISLPDRTLRALNVFVDACHRIAQAFEDRKDTIEAFVRGEKAGIPKVMYHASIKARKLYESGFSLNHDGVAFGLGGSVEDKLGHPAVSFTTDAKIAFQIARTFKEAALIADGHVKAREILAWAKQDGVEDKVVDVFNTTWARNVSIKRQGAGWVAHPWVQGSYSHDLGEAVDLEEGLDLEAKFRLYTTYLAMSPERYDPLFMDADRFLASLKSVDANDIGVISAEIDLSYPGLLFESGMDEYRVAPAAILKVLRFYR